MRPVNLLPDGQRPRYASGAMAGSAYVVLAVLAALLLAALAYVLTANQVTSRQDQAAKAEREAAAAEARTGELGRFGNFAQVKATREASIKGLAEARFDWERLMRELSRVLPEGAWLTELDASASGSTSTASSGGSSGGTSAAPASSAAPGAPSAAAGAPTAKLVGCARSQPVVATLMVRLRRLHRVEDVTLSESGQEGAAGSGAPAPVAGAGGSTGCGRSYKFDLTVSFAATAARAPGASSVPASLGGGS